MLKVDFRAMGCQMAALLDREDEVAARALQQVPGWFEQWEQALSRFRPNSELSRLNTLSAACAARGSRVGTPFQASPTLFEVVLAALQAADFTAGLVTPTLLAALELAGYDRSFEHLSAEGALPPVRTVVTTSANGAEGGSSLILLDSTARTITLAPGCRIDLGGIGKGWAAQQASQRLGQLGPALVDAGGDLACSDWQVTGQPWPIEVTDPVADQPAHLGILALGPQGLATSGIDYRRWQKAGRAQHHIIDPRTGQPAETDLLSVTVLAPDVLQAEAAAKAVLILGSEAGLDWLATRPELSALLVHPDGFLRYGNDFLSHYWDTYLPNPL